MHLATYLRERFTCHPLPTVTYGFTQQITITFQQDYTSTVHSSLTVTVLQKNYCAIIDPLRERGISAQNIFCQKYIYTHKMVVSSLSCRHLNLPPSYTERSVYNIYATINLPPSPVVVWRSHTLPKGERLHSIMELCPWNVMTQSLEYAHAYLFRKRYKREQP